jgi:hypothetical protein
MRDGGEYIPPGGGGVDYLMTLQLTFTIFHVNTIHAAEVRSESSVICHLCQFLSILS